MDTIWSSMLNPCRWSGYLHISIFSVLNTLQPQTSDGENKRSRLSTSFPCIRVDHHAHSPSWLWSFRVTVWWLRFPLFFFRKSPNFVNHGKLRDHGWFLHFLLKHRGLWCSSFPGHGRHHLLHLHLLGALDLPRAADSYLHWISKLPENK